MHYLEMGSTMLNGKKIVVVLPAYNAAKTLEMTYREIPFEFVDDVVLVDDASRDDTAEVAQRLGIRTVIHPRNRGYGGNQKTCYKTALDLGADIVVMLHPDYQYTPNLIVAMGSMIAYGEFDAVLASRILGVGALKGGMPLYKYCANRMLTLVENLLLGHKLSEYHTGYRAFSRRVLEAIPLGAGRQQRRLRVRQPDAGPDYLVWPQHRRSLLPHQVFRGRLVHQFPPQRGVRTGGAQDGSPVPPRPDGAFEVGHFRERKILKL